MSKSALTIERESRVQNGFAQESINVPNINEGANVNGTLLNKLGTSIPTPFARLHLFASAFEEVVENKIFDPNNNYLKLVSVALDMLEFMYLNGASNALQLVEWNVAHQSELLRESRDVRHHNFADAIESAWKNGGYAGRSISMIKYGDEYIGGTSPLSLFFTNPNMTGTYPGLSRNHDLFSTEVALDLLDRTPEFRLYVYKLFTYNAASLGTLSFGRYVNERLKDDMANDKHIKKVISDFKAISNHEDMMREFSQPSDGGQTLTKIMLPTGVEWIFPVNGKNGSEDVDFFVKDISNISFGTGYKIAATRDHYNHYEVNGATKSMRTPLVLNDAGIEAPYVDSTYWRKGSLPLSDANIPIHQRKLPNTEIKYPYVMASDFLQDKLIQVSYNIQKGKFYTGLEEDTKFLLPLKREFFKYFGPEDIEGKITFEPVMDHMGRISSVKVRLMIPLEGGRSIPLDKEYKMEDGDIVMAFEEGDTFNLGFFPFFVDMEKPETNRYKVLGAHSTNAFSLDFVDSARPDYTFQEYKEGANADQATGEVIMDERSNTTNGKFSTKHYDINRVFDIVEVNVTAGGVAGQGLVLPKMRKLNNTVNAAKDYSFGVDFGTTNTHIAYLETVNGAIVNDANRDIPTLEITVGGEKDEVQMVFLNDHDVAANGVHLTEFGFGMFGEMKDIAAREFVLPSLSKNTFPMRTAVCEVDNLSGVQKPRLFSALNIGFNYSNELSLFNGKNRYQTELKWDYSDNKAHERIRVFFEQLLWMMRNKSLLNEGKHDINVVVTYPQAMDGGVEYDFKEAWKKAARNVGIDASKIDFQLESIAPYYSFSRTVCLTDGNGSYVNMDIGGGSTDILYFDQNQKGERLTFSVFFAANDIWGDGSNKLLQGGNNGYIRMYEKSSYYANLTQEAKEKYTKIKGSTGKSSDIINFLFKNDEIYGFTRAINRTKISLVPVLHFSALMYYMAHFVEAFDLKLPKKLSFTGMGSSYLKMLGEPDNLAKLANAIIDNANEKTDSSLTVMFAEQPKKVTASGAVMIRNAQALGIDLIRPEREICYGVEDEEGGETRITVQDIRDNKDKKKVMALYSNIADMLENDQRVRDILTSMGLSEALNALPAKNDLLTILSDSFDSYQQIYERAHAQDSDKTKVQESLFFWPLKDGLYQLGLKVAE